LSANYARKQTVISQSTGEQATRLSWVGLDGKEEWKPWNKNEMLPSLSFMDTFTVIGDSYSAGHLSDMKGGAISPTRFAWGNILAKDIGAKCVNLSVSGYTAYDWATNKISDLNKTPVQDLYIIALGINDALPSHDEALGTIADINDDPNKNANTFYGNYGKIISAIKHHDVNARIILLTIMTKYDSTSRKDEFNTAIKNIGAKYNIPVADLDQESYFASNDFNNLKNGGHPTIVGYSLMARALKHAIQKTIYQNNTYFDEWAKTMD
jgi:lysophospholipase L1-like esterase